MKESELARKRHKPEEIIAKLPEMELLLSQGQTAGQDVRSVGITEQTYYRWRKEFGELKVDQAKRLKDLEKENALSLPETSSWFFGARVAACSTMTPDYRY